MQYSIMMTMILLLHQMAFRQIIPMLLCDDEKYLDFVIGPQTNLQKSRMGHSGLRSSTPV